MGLGVSPRAVERAVERRALLPVRLGVYRLPGAPVTQDQAWLAAVLAATADVLLSHGSAAAAWTLRAFGPPERIDLLTTGVRPTIDGVRGHSTISLPAADRTRLRRIPITSAERTLVDACGLVPFGRLERSVDDALRRRLIRLPKLVRTFDAIPTSGRRRRRPMERVLAERVPGFHPGGSGEELDVLEVLRRADIRPLPIQQHRIDVEGNKYYLDYGWPDTKVALEYDSREFHTRVSDFHHDQQRIRHIQRAGWVRWPVTKRTTENEIIAIALEGSGQGGT